MNISRHARALACIASVAALLVTAGGALAQNTNSKIANTRHNLSASGSGGVKANATTSGTDQICVFCHTPHAANAAAPGPLWNRNLSTQTYTPYTSNSLDAEDILNNSSIGQPGGASKLCLSCHDGTLAIGQVSNSPGSGSGRTISMTGTRSTASTPFVAGGMPAGSGDTTGYTRNLGINLTNDHPISFTFQNPPPAVTTDVLSQRDGELRSPPYSVSGKVVVGIRSPGNKPMLPLDHEGKVQCTSCHDPHLDASKFLRLNRLQATSSPGTTFDPAKDQICLGCHDRNMGSAFLPWSNSAHAKSGGEFENYTYKSGAGSPAAQREFPTGTTVWQAGCLNCHDTHTVQGSRRLLREGTDSTASPKTGGNPAIEETCYQCHSNSTTTILNNTALTATTGVPDIKTEFTTAGNRRMPITSADQPGSGNEYHDIGGNFSDPTFVDCTTTNNKCGSDFIESRSTLGANNHSRRHVECTDCHNPHRVIKNALFNGLGAANRRTHVPSAGTGGADGNVASGALRGAWGVEPTYPGTLTDFPVKPTTYTVKRGDPGSNTGTGVDAGTKYLTREYQLCFKCHSDYGAGDNFPSLGSYTGGTASGTNSMTTYTNVAAEFAAKATNPPTSFGDQGEQTNAGSACGGGDCDPTGTSPQSSGATGNNHRSWHPVIWPTGRDSGERLGVGNSTSINNFRPPFRTNLGTQTMYCSDCHGNSASWTQGTSGTDTANGPDLATVQGPHGSPRNFVLKGYWDLTVTPTDSRGSNTSNGICGRCHHPDANSGFDGSPTEASHAFTTKSTRPCMRCHIAVPHGWKNKAFLVNLECVGPEGGQGAGCTPVGNDTSGGTSTSTHNIGPYYNSAVLRIRTWQASGRWTEASCGAPNYSGKDWMSDVSGCQ